MAMFTILVYFLLIFVFFCSPLNFIQIIEHGHNFHILMEVAIFFCIFITTIINVPTRMNIIKIYIIISVGKDKEKLEPSYVAGGYVKW